LFSLTVHRRDKRSVSLCVFSCAASAAWYGLRRHPASATGIRLVVAGLAGALPLFDLLALRFLRCWGGWQLALQSTHEPSIIIGQARLDGQVPRVASGHSLESCRRKL
jgi:hypothetical protein